MNKVLIVALACSLTLIGLSATSQTNKSYQIASIDKAETQRFLALEKPKVIIKKTYKKNEQLSPRDLKAILYEAGFRGSSLKEAWAVAMKESTGRPRSHNDNPKTGDNSYGLFQINMIGSLGPARLEQYGLETNKDLFNPLVNARIAFQMSDGGKNWSAWNGLGSSTTKWFKDYPG
jgi:hypothetical protein